MRQPDDRDEDVRRPGGLAGEQEDLLELSRDLRRLAGHLLKDPGTADDVVQEAWLAALERPPGEVRTLAEWMRAVVRRIAQRRLQHERRRADLEALVAVRDEVAFDAEIDARLSTQRLLRAAVDEVREPARAVLVAHYFEGRTLESVARSLARPLETVRTQRRRGLEELRAVLDRRHKGDRSAWSGLLAFVTGDGATRRVPRRLAVGAAAALLVATTVFLAFELAGDPGVPRSTDEAAAVEPRAPAETRTSDRADPGADARGRVEVAAVEPPAPPPSAPAAAAAAPRNLAIRVVDADGKPVPGASVFLFSSMERFELVEQHTDADGRTTFEAGAEPLLGQPYFAPPARGVSIRADAPGMAHSPTYLVPIPEGGTSFELALRGPEQVLIVTVVEPDGTPIAGAQVEVGKRARTLPRGADGISVSEPPQLAPTGADGKAEIRNLPWRAHEVDVSADGFVPRTMTVPELDQRVVHVQLELSRGATLAGDVRDADGRPVAGAEVFAPGTELYREKPPGTRTDSDGRFRLSGLTPGTRRIFARAPEPGEGRADAVVELEAIGETLTSLTLEPRAKLRVRLRDARSESVAGTTVFLRTRAGVKPSWQARVWADAEGVCEFDTFPSEVLEGRVVRGTDGYSYGELQVDGRAPAEVLVEIEIGAQAAVGALRGAVLDARGAPLSDAFVLELRDLATAEYRLGVDAATGAFASSAVARGFAKWIVVAREGIAELGAKTVEAGASVDLGTVYAPPPGRVRIRLASPLPAGAALVLKHRTWVADVLIGGRVRRLEPDERELELLPYEYSLKVELTADGPRAPVVFRVTSGSVVDVVVP